MQDSYSLKDKIHELHPGWEVPDCQVTTLRKKKHKYVVIVFVINEGGRIKAQLRRMEPLAGMIDIAIADGGSTDGSLEINSLRKNKITALLTKTGKGKLSAQMRMAFAWALVRGYEGIVVVDGNGKDSIQDIPSFIRLLDQGYDHIQGSRFIPGGKAINTPLERYVAVRLLHAPLISLAAHHLHTDTTNGFRAYSARLLRDPELSIFRGVFDSYELHYYLAIESARSDKNYRLTETPVTREYPKKGKTPTKISPIKGNAKVLSILLMAALRMYRK